MKKIIIAAGFLMFVFLFFGGSRAFAAADLATNVFPNDQASEPDLSMIVGSGEFDSNVGAAVVITRTTGSFNLRIEEASWCNLDSYYSYRAQDLPKQSEFSVPYFNTDYWVISGTDFSFKKQNNGTNATYSTGFNRECENRDKTMSVNITESDYDEQVNGYKVIILALAYGTNPAYGGTVPGAAENSFRFIVNGPAGSDPRIYFSTQSIPLTDTNNFNLANRNRPTNSYATYSTQLALPCSTSLPELKATLKFYDVDNGLYQDTGAPNYYPKLEYKLDYKLYKKSPPRNKPPSQWPPEEWTTLRDWTRINGGDGDTDAVLNDYPFMQGAIYRVSVRGLTWMNAITYDLTAKNINSYFADPENCLGDPPPPPKQPVGVIDQCKLIGDKTVIYGWAYDKDAGDNTNLPRVDVKVGGQTVSAAANRYYRRDAVNEYLYNNRDEHGTASIDGTYGFEAEFTGLVQGTRYPVSGIVNNRGEGTDQEMNVRESNRLDGQDVFGFPNGNVPAECIAPPITAKTSCRLVGFSQDEAGIEGDFRVNFRHAQSSDSPNVFVVSLEILDYGNFTPTQGDMKNDYLGSPIPVPRGGSLGMTSKRGVFPESKNYQNVVARIYYLYGRNGQIVRGGTFCASDIHTYNKPYPKIFGGDIWAGGAFNGSCGNSAESVKGYATSNGGYRGASAQFGITAMMNMKEFYSSSQRGGSNRPPKGSTFSNTGAAEYGNSFDTGGSPEGVCMTNYYGTKNGAINSAFNGSIPGDQGIRHYTATPNAVLTNSQLLVNKGTQAAVYVNGDVYITQNILYHNTARTSTKDIPFFALIAKGNIYIGNNVTRLDGMYIAQPNGNAKGNIFTCSNVVGNSASLFSSRGNEMYQNCSQQLSINGALIANRVRFLRTNGSLRFASPGEMVNLQNGNGTGAAEVINFTPELYLAPSPFKDPEEDGGENGKYDAIYSLPPVF